MPSSRRASLAMTAWLVKTRMMGGFAGPDGLVKVAVTVTER